MDRKAIIAITLSVLLLIGSQVYLAKYAPRPVPTAPSTASHPSPAATPDLAATPEPVTQATPAPAEPQPAPEITETRRTPVAEYLFSTRGGGIARTTLVNHIAENSENVAMNHLGKIPIGALSATPGELDLASQKFTMVPGVSTEEITFESAPDSHPVVRKKFTLTKPGDSRDEYIVQLDIEYANRGTAPVEQPARFLHLGTALPIHRNDLPTYTGFDWFRNGRAKETNVAWFAAGRIPVLGIPTSSEKPFYTETADSIRWAAVKNQYFTTIATFSDAIGASVWARRVPLPEDTTHFGIEGAVALPGFQIAPGETRTEHVDLYIGPKEYQRLNRLGQDQDEVLHFGMFGIVSKVLLNSMNWLNSVFRNFGGYATAIIVLTLAIKTALWPIQNRATNSMKRMQAMQPRLTELREKYKDDPARMNQEMMRLYKEYGINPMGGCLPMLIQIPVFFGFYSMLGTAIELRNSRFFWVDDLSQPDTIARIAGIPINVLPLLMAATMFWQMAITPKSGDKMQQRLMMFMPLIFIAFCYNFASALALYWTVQNIFSIVQLYLTRNRPAPALVKVHPTSPAKGKKKR
jgi:YidC/Oxa1 family membrane protein insertase